MKKWFTMSAARTLTMSLVVSAILMAGVYAGAQTNGLVQGVVICKNPSKSVRTLRVYETNEKNENGENAEGCRATYTKSGDEQTVGTSRQVQQCQTILSGIRKNLEASNWTCRQVGTMATLKSTAAEANEALVPADASGSASDKKTTVQ